MNKIESCDHCILGKQHSVEFESGVHKSSIPFEYAHSSICGPTRVKTYVSDFYLLIIIDGFSRRVWVYIRKSHIWKVQWITYSYRKSGGN